MTNIPTYIQKLEAENLRLQELLEKKEEEIKEKKTESFSRGFRKGILQSESMSEHVLNEWRRSNTIKYPSVFK